MMDRRDTFMALAEASPINRAEAATIANELGADWRDWDDEEEAVIRAIVAIAEHRGFIVAHAGY